MISTRLLKIFIAVLNVALAVIGVACVYSGTKAFTYESDFMKSHMGKKTIDTVEQEVRRMPGEYTPKSTSTETSTGKLSKLFGLTQIIIGGALVVLSIIGSFIAARSCTLGKIYVVLVILALLAAQAAFISYQFLFKNHYDNAAADSFLSYTGWGKENTDTLLWNVRMLKFGCCGLKGLNSLAISPNASVNNHVACCKTKGKYPFVLLVDNKCPGTATVANAYVTKGCLDELRNDFLANQFVLIYFIVACVVLVIQIVLCLIFIITGKCEIKSNLRATIDQSVIDSMDQQPYTSNAGDQIHKEDVDQGKYYNNSQVYDDRHSFGNVKMVDSEYTGAPPKRRFYILGENTKEALGVTFDALKELPIAIFKGTKAVYNHLNPHPLGLPTKEQPRYVRDYATEREARDNNVWRRVDTDKYYKEMRVDAFHRNKSRPRLGRA